MSRASRIEPTAARIARGVARCYAPVEARGASTGVRPFLSTSPVLEVCGAGSVAALPGRCRAEPERLNAGCAVEPRLPGLEHEAAVLRGNLEGD